MPVASFHLVRYPGIRDGVPYMAWDRPVLRRTAACGSSGNSAPVAGDTMTLSADLRRWALFAVWDDEAALDAFLATSEIAARWRTAETYTVRLAPVRAHGEWGGVDPLGGSGRTGRRRGGGTGRRRGGGTGRRRDGGTGRRRGGGTGRRRGGRRRARPRRFAGRRHRVAPVAILTRAAIRPRQLLAFHRAVPGPARALHGSPGLLASVAIGEVPVLRQATFSLWRDLDAVQGYAYRTAAHAEVVKRTRAERWYSEELFARFVPYGAEGTWDGRDPLS